MHTRLEFWSTLPRDELVRRVRAEEQRIKSLLPLTFAEKQLLDAARERLAHWRAPHDNWRTTMTDDTETTNEAAQPEQTAKAQPKKEKTVKKTASKKTASKKTAKKVVVKKAAKSKKNGSGTKLFDMTAKVTWAGKANPFRPGSGAHKRTEIVHKASGRTVETVLGLSGIKNTTLRTLFNKQLVRIG
jgi:hypothetical protein